MRKWLCFILHKWGAWSGVQSDGFMDHQERQCLRCGRIERKDVWR